MCQQGIAPLPEEVRHGYRERSKGARFARAVGPRSLVGLMEEEDVANVGRGRATHRETSARRSSVPVEQRGSSPHDGAEAGPRDRREALSLCYQRAGAE